MDARKMVPPRSARNSLNSIQSSLTCQVLPDRHGRLFGYLIRPATSGWHAKLTVWSDLGCKSPFVLPFSSVDELRLVDGVYRSQSTILVYD